MIKEVVKLGLGWSSSKPDMCVPGKSMSISEIIARFVFDPNAVTKSGAMYDEDDDYEEDETRDPSFDFADAFAMKQKLEEQKEMNDIIKAEQASRNGVSNETESQSDVLSNEGSSSEVSQPSA